MVSNVEGEKSKEIQNYVLNTPTRHIEGVVESNSPGATDGVREVCGVDPGSGGGGQVIDLHRVCCRHVVVVGRT